MSGIQTASMLTFILRLVEAVPPGSQARPSQGISGTICIWVVLPADPRQRITHTLPAIYISSRTAAGGKESVCLRQSPQDAVASHDRRQLMAD